ncbi:Major centromere autoantigen B [Dictyocoela muelleri]|nr:Major centromere autoantigen B [Dictyocoela muelleri]
MKKKEIRKELSNGKTSERDLVKKFKTSKGSIFKIKKLIKENKRGEGWAGLCKNKTEKFEKLDHLLFEVFLNLRNLDIPLNGLILKSIALKISDKIGLRNFKASKTG